MKKFLTFSVWGFDQVFKSFGWVLGFLTSLVWGLRVFNMVSGSLIRVFRVFNPCEMVFNRGLKAFSRAF